MSEGKSWKWTHTLAHQTKNCLVLWIIGLYTLKIIDFYSKNYAVSFAICMWKWKVLLKKNLKIPIEKIFKSFVL